jgi:hypothetical protein
MGFMDRIKGAAKQAGHTAQMGMGGGGMLEHRNVAIKLNESGVNHPATLKGLSETGRTDPGGGKETEFTVEVDPGEPGAYEATFTQFILAGQLGSHSEGSRITVRVDPDDPSSMMFWGS